MKQIDEGVACLYARVRGAHNRAKTVGVTAADRSRDMAAPHIVNQDGALQIGCHENLAVGTVTSSNIPCLGKAMLFHFRKRVCGEQEGREALWRCQQCGPSALPAMLYGVTAKRLLIAESDTTGLAIAC